MGDARWRWLTEERARDRSECLIAMRPGAQAADFFAYCTYRAELLEHGQEPTAIENSSFATISSTAAVGPPTKTGPVLFRIPISREILQDLKKDLFLREAERKAFG